jgi:hypothetical protein
MALQERALRAVRGEVALFEEVENDQGATTEALIIVVVAALASGIGSALGAATMGYPGGSLAGLVGGVISSLVGWAVFSFIAFFIGTRLFSAQATWEEVLRPLGYAYTPGILGILSFIPVLGWLIAVLAGLWVLYLAFLAIRAALDIDTGKTIATILLSIIPTIIIAGLISLPFQALRGF